MYSNASQLISHNGGLPGVSTYIFLSPHDGTGVVALSNADEKQPALGEVAHILLHKVWGIQEDPLPSVSFVETRLNGMRRVPEYAVSASAPEELPPYDFTGLYLNEGYGAFLLCDSKSTSAHCATVLDDFAAVDAPEKPKSTELYASWPRLWTSHVRASYAGDMRFVIQVSQLFPQGYGKNTTPFELFGGGAFADFVVRDDGEVLGFGLFGLAGERTNREKKGGSVEDTAEVWFDRATWKRV